MNNMNKSYKYIKFLQMKKSQGGMFYICLNSRGEYRLGLIKWYPPWSQYCFFPERDSVFNKTCLDDISDFCKNWAGR